MIFLHTTPMETWGDSGAKKRSITRKCPCLWFPQEILSQLIITQEAVTPPTSKLRGAFSLNDVNVTLMFLFFSFVMKSL